VLEAPVDPHYFYEDDLPPVLAWNSQIEVCQPNGEWDTPHTYTVQGFNANGAGPMSDSLTVIWPSEPVPEPEPWQLFLGGYLLLMFLFWRRQHRG
jgi:hypothetical protein